jgi:hypothetical protein
MRRRDFIYSIPATAALFHSCSGDKPQIEGLRLTPTGTLGGIQSETAKAPIESAVWYTATELEDGVTYTVDKGALASSQYLTADFLQDGKNRQVFSIVLEESETGRKFNFRFAGLAQCSYRVRLPLSLVDQNRWGIDREGAFLKPRVGGDRVDLSQVDRMSLYVSRKQPGQVRWCMTDFIATELEPPLITEPMLPKGKLLDEIGQSTLHDWPQKTKSVDDAVALIQMQYKEAPTRTWPEGFSRWGGWKAKRLGSGSGFFGVKKEGQRWWLVDPEGYAFWSAGADCVRLDSLAAYTLLESALTWLPEVESDYKDCFAFRTSPSVGEFKTFTYLGANLIRALGADGWRQKWADTALGVMKQLRFNTVGNWSEWEYAKAAQFPYVRPMSFNGKRIQKISRDFPDVFDPNFEADAADYAATLADTKDDPAFIGYFLMNEPTWGFSSELPAAGMLWNSPANATRKALADWLRKKYTDDAALAAAWKLEVNFEQIAGGAWDKILTSEANADLEGFSALMATRYFRGLSDACRKVDPNHLNLGMRWAGVPPMWAVEGMKSFDVFSMNCYMDRVPRATTDQVHELLGMPVLIGEWHFGALDVGMPSSGIGHLKNQTDRAKAYRVYLEDAAANPNCVGAHWFNLYDQSALGRFDGENYNIGFLDVCHRPYKEMAAAATISHEEIYDVASGKRPAYDDVPEYLPKLF